MKKGFFDMLKKALLLFSSASLSLLPGRLR